MIIKTLTLAILLFTLPTISSAESLTEEDKSIQTADMLLHSTVVVTNGYNQGAGFYIEPYEIITASHVVDSGVMWIKKADGTPCLAWVEKTDKAHDLTLIRACEEGTPLKLADSVKLGQSVLTMGHPISQEFFLSKGIVSSLRKDGILMHDGLTNSGSSGGAVVNLSGEVIGVSRAVFAKDERMSEAVSVDELKIFLKGSGK